MENNKLTIKIIILLATLTPSSSLASLNCFYALATSQDQELGEVVYEYLTKEPKWNKRVPRWDAKILSDPHYNIAMYNYAAVERLKRNLKLEDVKRILEEEGTKLDKDEVLEYYKSIYEDISLMLDTESKHSQVLEFLKHTDFDVNARHGHNDVSLLELAIELDNISIIKFLLKHPDIKMEYGMHMAIQSGNLEIFKLLFEHPNFEINSSFYLEEAIHSKNLEMSKLLLDNPDINVNLSIDGDDTPLMAAARDRENLEIFKLLLEHPDIDANVYVNDDGRTALKVAVESDNIEAVKLLLDHFDIDVNGPSDWSTILMLAVDRSTINLNMVKLLLEHYLKIEIPFKLLLDHPDLKALVGYIVGAN